MTEGGRRRAEGGGQRAEEMIEGRYWTCGETSLASLSLTHILTRVDIPRPFRFARSLSSSRVGSSSRNVNTRFFRNTNSSGLGRKSSTILPVFMGSSVYLIFLVIYFSPFSPIPRPNNSDASMSFSEACGHDATFNLAKTKKPIFCFAVVQILNNYSTGIGKSILCIKKRHPMLLLILLVFQKIPLKSCCHVANVIQSKGFVK